MTESEFKTQWLKVVDMFGVQQNEWVKMMYCKRKLWAETFLRNTFFGGLRSTQRSESINYFLNQFLHRRLKLYEFMSHINRAMSRLRNNEMKDDFDTINEHPVLVTHLLQLEKHDAEVYTRNIFAWVRDEIKSEAKLSILNCVDDMDNVMYKFKKFDASDKTWNVRYTPSINIFKYSCEMFETMGIPCCHAFSVMKAMNQHHIPETLIMQRWTKNAKDVSELDSSSTVTTPDIMQLARFHTRVTKRSARSSSKAWSSPNTISGSNDADQSSFPLRAKARAPYSV
ncbi:hypothetical protein LWI29_012259 [Acer saccharum]|uniref:Protein FAR1-RELATED SEQUENCE n=1 Tax=Acer saccharum TaxID=4024 RepID=A0AA39RLP8_ACESA|nr:hypothetical protein LWI29_012259 [Acer saccharum]